MMRVAANIAFLVVATIGFGIWIRHVVQSEFALGLRTAAQGDAILVPTAGFALYLAGAMIAANLVWFVARTIRRRRSQGVRRNA